MSDGYVSIQWNNQKQWYDFCIFLAVVIYIGVYFATSLLLAPEGQHVSEMIIAIRATGSLAFFMLSFILIIGPLTRLSKLFSPLHYNRRHLGVALGMIALTHGILSIVWYHGYGVLNPIVSVILNGGGYRPIIDYPFQLFGFAALIILTLMLLTSHDFWLKNLSPKMWKFLHSLVYVAYGLIFLHLTLGPLSTEQSGLNRYVVWGIGVTLVLVHIISSFKVGYGFRDFNGNYYQGWIVVGVWQIIPEDRAVIVTLPNGKQVGIFRYRNRLAALENKCAHQNGPLGKGKVIKGCATCPWHGHFFQLEDGCAPPPYDDAVHTYKLRLRGDLVELWPDPLPLRTRSDLPRIEQWQSDSQIKEADKKMKIKQLNSVKTS